MNKITVAIPFYNSLQYFEDAIRIPLLDDRVDEILVCDDCSSEEQYNGLLEKVESLKQPYKDVTLNFIDKEVEDFNKIKRDEKFSYLKQIFSKSYPVLTFDGVGSSVIKSFHISNNMDPATTTHLINKVMDEAKSDKLLQETYTKVVPGKITMESLGFPLAEVHQTFFVDMNTGTDIDNLYHITSVSHNIEPGSFKTSYELANADNYGSHINLYSELDRIKKVLTGDIKEIAPPPQKQKNGSKKPAAEPSKPITQEEVDAMGRKVNAAAKEPK